MTAKLLATILRWRLEHSEAALAALARHMAVQAASKYRRHPALKQTRWLEPWKPTDDIREGIS